MVKLKERNLPKFMHLTSGKKLPKELPGSLKIWHCHCYGSGSLLCLGFDPCLELLHVRSMARKKKKKKKIRSSKLRPGSDSNPILLYSSLK